MKTVSIFTISLAALTFSACGATTGGLAQAIAQNAAVSAVTSQPAQNSASVASAPANAAADAALECSDLTAQMANVDASIIEANQIIAGGGRGNVAGQVAATGASQAALHSGAAGAISKVPFGGLFAKAAMDSVANSGQKKVEQAQVDLQAAHLRKATLSGLYAGKNCGQ